MRRLIPNLALVVIAVAFLVLSGCASRMSYTYHGAVIGAGVGAALGQAVGRNWQSTVIGAGAGAIVGGAAGALYRASRENQVRVIRIVPGYHSVYRPGSPAAAVVRRPWPDGVTRHPDSADCPLEDTW